MVWRSICAFLQTSFLFSLEVGDPELWPPTERTVRNIRNCQILSPSDDNELRLGLFKGKL